MGLCSLQFVFDSSSVSLRRLQLLIATRCERKKNLIFAAGSRKMKKMMIYIFLVLRLSLRCVFGVFSGLGVLF